MPIVGARSLQQIQPVGLGLGERLFVSEDHLFGILVQLAQGDEAAPFLHDTASGYGEALRIGEYAGFLFLNQYALLAPRTKIPGRARVDILALFGIEEFRKTENNADQIIGAPLIIGLLHRRRYLVVRLGDHVIQANR